MAINSVLDEVATFLAAQITSLSVGSTLFKGGLMPDDPVRCTLIRRTGSIENDPWMVDRSNVTGHIVSHIRKDLFQVTTRAGRADEADEIQQQIYLVLHGRNNFTLTNLYVYACSALASPQLLEAKPGEHRYVTNYFLHLRDNSTL